MLRQQQGLFAVYYAYAVLKNMLKLLEKKKAYPL